MKTKLTHTITAVVLTLGAGPALAETDQSHFTISYISDAAQGRTLNHQKYEAAIQRLENIQQGGMAGFYTANNLCVAYMKTGDLDSAKETCDLAVDRIQNANRREQRTGYYANTGNDYDTLKAIALSNRGVLHAVNNELELARNDFDAALSIEADVSQPQMNLARLKEIANPES